MVKKNPKKPENLKVSCFTSPANKAIFAVVAMHKKWVRESSGKSFWDSWHFHFGNGGFGGNEKVAFRICSYYDDSVYILTWGMW